MTAAHAPSAICVCDGCCEDRAAQVLVDAIARRDALSPRDAAVAAGARTEAEVERLAARIAADRQTSTAA